MDRAEATAPGRPFHSGIAQGAGGGGVEVGGGGLVSVGTVL